MITTDIKEVTTEELEKSQLVRLIDIVLIGPFLIYTSTKTSIPMYFRAGLMIIGIATILYNGNNYIKNLKNE